MLKQPGQYCDCPGCFYSWVSKGVRVASGDLKMLLILKHLTEPTGERQHPFGTRLCLQSLVCYTLVPADAEKGLREALGITGLVVAMPVFFDAGLIILIPLAFSLAKRTKRSVLYYVIPLLAGQEPCRYG